MTNAIEMAPDGMTFARCSEVKRGTTSSWQVRSTCPRKDCLGARPVTNCNQLVLLVPNETRPRDLIEYGAIKFGEFIPQHIDSEFSAEQRKRINAAYTALQYAESKSDGWSLQDCSKLREKYYAIIAECREENSETEVA